MGHKYIDIDVDRAAEMYLKKEMSYEEIAEVLGCSSATIRNRLVERGIKFRKKGYRRDHKLKRTALKPRIIYLYVEREMSYKQIAQELGNISFSYIGQLLRKWGVKVRRQGHKKSEKVAMLPVDTIIRQYVDEELSKQIIANLHGVSQGTIIKILKEHNVPGRTLSEAKKAYWARRRKQKEAVKEVVLDTDDIDGLALDDQIRHLRNSEDAFIQDIASTLDVEPGYVLEVLSQ